MISPIEAISKTMDAFAEAGLDAPTAIILKDREQGMRLLKAVRSTVNAWWSVEHYKPVEHPDGSVWIEMKCMGVALRWPAQQRALEKGGFKWE